MIKKLLLATNNQHKIEEFGEILTDLPLTLTTPAEIGLTLDPEETGTTFEANAAIKAKAFAAASGLLVMADDSGLEVDALNGEPGVYSAHYRNTPRPDHALRNQLVLQQMVDVAWERRTARYRCVIVFAYGDDLLGQVAGTVEGFIDYAPKGSNGFGYDPIFYEPTLGQTMGEMSPAEKHKLSHRGRAGQAAAAMLPQILAKLAHKG